MKASDETIRNLIATMTKTIWELRSDKAARQTVIESIIEVRKLKAILRNRERVAAGLPVY